MHALNERLKEYLAYKKLGVTEFTELLGYSKPEKIYRLFRKDDAMPSAEIIIDVSNKFEDLNGTWWLTGKGSMLNEGITPLPIAASTPLIAANEPIALYDKHPPASDFASPSASPSGKKHQKTIELPPGNTQVYNLGTPKVISANENREENIIYVPIKARAGYLLGYGDPEFMETLPTFRLPGLTNSTYRMFEVEGPSMTPGIINGDRVIGEWLEDMNHIRDNRVYVVVTRTGIVIKRLLNRIKERNKIVLRSDTIAHRKDFPTYEIDPEDILELWYSRLKLSSDFSEPAELYHKVSDMEADIAHLLSESSLLKGENHRIHGQIAQIWKAINK